MDLITQQKWDRAAPSFDFMSSYGPEKRWAPAKKEFFARMRSDAEILFLALGTGLDLRCFPSQRRITAIDISPKMIARAQQRLADYDGDITAKICDVHEIDFPDEYFDQIFTSCTFCSVPNPVAGLKSLRRVLKPNGELHMFEHTGSRWFPFNVMLNTMTPLTSKFGPSVNRNTTANVRAAGFTITAVNNIYLDVVKSIHALK